MLLLSVLPIAVFMIFLFFLRWPFYKIAPLAFFVTMTISILAWKIPPQSLISVALKALLLTGDIVLIIFGAILFVSFLKETGSLSQILEQLKKITPNKETQTLLFAWLFGSFIEGISGFGTSGAIVAPFLVGIGISPFKAIVVSLASNSTAVTFGAVGTPVRIGLAEFSQLSFVHETALINILPAFFITIFIVYFVCPRTRFITFLKNNTVGPMLAASVFLVPYALMARYSSEYPSILGGGIGFLAYLAILSRGALRTKILPVVKSFSSYGILLTLLVLGKFFFSSFNVLLNLGNQLTHNIQAFNPGFAFITTVLILAVKRKTSLRSLLLITKTTTVPLQRTAISIFFVSAMTYLMIMTDRILLQDGMLETIASHLIGPGLLYYSAFIGAFGSFLAGSATVSNLLFAQIQFLGSSSMHLPHSLILALQLTGAAAGNMIALPNILAVQAAVGEEGKEREALLALILPCGVYLMIATIVVLLFF